RWGEWYASREAVGLFRSLRRAKLARVLRFYADKAHRHHLPDDVYQRAIDEIDRMVEKGEDYQLLMIEGNDRGWIFCPEYTGDDPQDVTPWGWETQIFLFGPSRMNELRSPY